MTYDKRTTRSAAAFAGAIALAASLSGCASIISGTTDEVVVSSEPPGAECVVYRSGDVIKRVPRTPDSISVERTSKTLLVECAKDGVTASEKAEAGFNAWTLGNFVFFPIGTIVGLIVDGVSGAGNGYDKSVTVNMAEGRS